MRALERLRDRLRAAARDGARAARAVAGVPDYERYLAHMRRHHPHVAPLTRPAFVLDRERARYDRPGARCC